MGHCIEKMIRFKKMILTYNFIPQIIKISFLFTFNFVAPENLKTISGLFQAGEGQFGTDESEFNKVLSLRSYPQLRATFQAYNRIADRDIMESIHREMSGDLEKAYLAIGKMSFSIFQFTSPLYSDMKRIVFDKMRSQGYYSRCVDSESSCNKNKNTFRKEITRIS